MLATSLAPWAAPAGAQSDAKLTTDTLPNGLTVIVHTNNSVPIATALIAVKTGAFTQRPDERGLAHLYEHVVFRGFGSDPVAFGREVANLSGTYNGTTSEDVVTYYVTVPADKTERAIELVARLVARGRFGDRDLDDERPVVLDELARVESDPQRQLSRGVEEALWADAWYRKDVGGDSATIRSISIDRLNEVFARYYVPNNAALIVTGDVDATAVNEAAAEHFSGWDRAPDPFAEASPLPVAPLEAHKAVVVGGNVFDVTIAIELHGPGLRGDTAATYAADALFDVLNGPSSAFQQRLVARGPFQSIEADYRTTKDVGPIAFRGTTTPEAARQALALLMDEIDALDALTGVTHEDLDIARAGRQVRAALANEQAAVGAGSIASAWAIGGVGSYERYAERLDTCTLDDMRRFATQYVAARPRVIGVLAAPQVATTIASWLTRGEGNEP